MWGYQQHFQISIQNTAENLFRELDSSFEPKVFLVGILSKDRNDRYPICVEPEECGYCIEIFKDVTELANGLLKVNRDKHTLHSDPNIQASALIRQERESISNAIKNILESEDYFHKKNIYVSYPIEVEDYLVSVVLEIQSSSLDNYYSLTKTEFANRAWISKSYTDSVIYIFLHESANALKLPNNFLLAIDRNTKELLNEAGKNFMYTISNVGNNFIGFHGLYNACNNISALKYEGKEGLGKLLIAKKNHDNVRLILELKEPIYIGDFRKVRKFLELTDNRYFIVCDSAYIYGLGEIRGYYNPKDESIFIIDFIDFYKWVVYHDGNPLMLVEFGNPFLPKERINKDKFYSDLKRIFNIITKSQIDNLWDITCEAIKQKHGTMLVISGKPEIESIRLDKQSFPIVPLKITPDIIYQVTSIDGAILMDIDSYCYSLGVILDGNASQKGDASRGARYNSAIRYYESWGKNFDTYIIIISEDGMIDITPNLKPQISHKLIIENINDFKNIDINKSNDYRKFNNLMDFFKKNEFYLTQDECNIINEFRKKYENEDKSKNEVGNFRIIREDLKPNDEMDESYYKDE